jgi:Tfp pilus assembly protein PilN
MAPALDPEELDELLDGVAEEPAEEEDPPPSLLARLGPWMIVLSLLIVFLVMFMTLNVLRELNGPLSDEVQAMASTLEANVETQSQEEADANEVLLQAIGQVNALEQLTATLSPSHFDWPMAMTALGNYDHKQVEITSLMQNGQQIVIEGGAADEAAVMLYVSALREYPEFSRVVVQSITLVPVQAGRDGLATGPFRAQQDFVEFVVTVDIGQAQS